MLAAMAVLAWMICGGSLAVLAQEQRVFDEAGLFSGEEVSALEEQIAEVRDQANMDLVIVTTDDALGKGAREYADDFYDEGGFGVGRELSGILFLIDMDNREICISTAGAMQRFFTDDRIDSMLDHAYELVARGDYAGAAGQAVEDASGWYRKGIPGGQYLYDEDTGRISRYRSIRWYELLMALGVAAFCAAGVCMNVKREYAMKQERRQAAGFCQAYRADAQFAFREKNDVLVNSYVTQQIIPRSSGRSGSGGGSLGGRSGGGRSTVHRSSSGRSHGGGSRRF